VTQLFIAHKPPQPNSLAAEFRFLDLRVNDAYTNMAVDEAICGRRAGT
jgi:hypothetical protein